MKSIFEFLSLSFIIIKLIEASDAGKPALSPVVETIENYFSDPRKTHKNTLDDTFTKQAIGLMVKTILEPFGYEVWKQKNLPKNSKAIKFQSASVYRFNIHAIRTMKVMKSISRIEPNEDKTQEEEAI